MGRRLDSDTLVIASHNPKKVKELEGLLAGTGIAVRTARDLGLAEPEEPAPDFHGNALIKAVAAATAAGLPSLADDSGLVVNGLDGAPGVHSARWAGPEQDYPAAMARIVDALANRFGSFAAADKAAAFVTVVCLAWPDGAHVCFEGRVDGHLVETPRGTGGFGYDPIFVPEGETRTFAELTAAEKDALSHRGRAMRAMAAACLAPAG
jgi:XTP/dITP diphosphohydrolase